MDEFPRPRPGRHDDDARVPAVRVLDDLPLQQPARVLRVTAPDTVPEWGPWLSEIGFLPGERVMLLVRGRPGGDPLVVRVGDSTFALHRAEAACIEVDTRPPDDERGA
jgi:ferrous iron transport protein A